MSDEENRGERFSKLRECEIHPVDFEAPLSLGQWWVLWKKRNEEDSLGWSTGGLGVRVRHRVGGEGMDGHARVKGRESSGAKEGDDAILQPVPRPKDLHQTDLVTLSVSRWLHRLMCACGRIGWLKWGFHKPNRKQVWRWEGKEGLWSFGRWHCST